MYPDFSYILHALFGTPVDNWASVIKTFGLLLAIAFFVSAYLLTLEFRRREQLGWLKPQSVRITVGAPASASEIVGNALLGFILGFKLLYIAQHFGEFKADAATVLFSGKGHWLGGLIGGLLFGAWRYWDAQKTLLPHPEEKDMLVYPHQRVGDITVVAALSGVLGAKLFAIVESVSTIKAFMSDPIGQLFSGSGLAIYGGLIVAFFVVYAYTRRLGIPPLQMMDAAAPALMIGYGVGRLGCHLSGDGDWGIVNTLAQPSWLLIPSHWWAFDYPHNVINDGSLIEGCTWNYCRKLDEAVFPTSIYETIMAFGITGILWFLRTRLPIPGMLFFTYLILNGIERFSIEKIRINEKIALPGGLKATQAEIIAVCFFVIGIIGLLVLYKRGRPSATAGAA